MKQVQKQTVTGQIDRVMVMKVDDKGQSRRVAFPEIFAKKLCSVC